MRHEPTPQFRSLHRQRGAIGLFAILVMLLAVLFTALALDTGRFAMEKRRLQKIADLAALDASRSLCSVKDVYAEAQASAVRNGYTGNLNAEGGVKVGTTTTNAAGIREFTEASAASANAVEVTVRAAVPASLVAGGLLGGQVNLTATGTARSGEDPIAGISAGSFLLRVDTSKSGLDSLLGGILGTTVNLDLVSYQGIAAANLSLLNLIQTHGGIGTVKELLELNLGIVDWIKLMATALANKGDDAAAVALNQLALLAVGNPNLRLGDLLKVTADDPQSAANAQVNALDLLALGAEVANGSHAIDLTTGIAIPGVTSIGLRLWVIEPPQIAIGPAGKDEAGNWKTQVKTAQIRLGITLTLLPGPIGIPLVATISLVDLSLALDVAPTTAWLEDITCPTPTNPNGSVIVGSTPGIATLAIGRLDANGNVIGPANVATVKLLLSLVTVSVGVSASTNIDSGALATDFDGPYPQTRTVGTDLGTALSNALSTLGNNLHFHVTVGSLSASILNQVIALLVPILRPIIAALGGVLAPLLQALGVNLGGADLGVFTILFTPETGRPKLVM
ncbi:MAG: uncharacterized protein H6R26_495 [Proteobacteria bacterium]|nr:uncharacterized protein [Pseudomonadota bacterium]